MRNDLIISSNPYAYYHKITSTGILTEGSSWFTIKNGRTKNYFSIHAGLGLILIIIIIFGISMVFRKPKKQV